MHLLCKKLFIAVFCLRKKSIVAVGCCKTISYMKQFINDSYNCPLIATTFSTMIQRAMCALIQALDYSEKLQRSPVADLGGREGCGPPGVEILSISCSFWENWAKSYVGAPWAVGASSSGKSWIRH